MRSLTRTVLTLMCIALFATACGTSRKQRENRKKRDAIVEKSGLICDFVKSDPDLETEIELNLKMAAVCDPRAPHSLTYHPLDAEMRGIVFCCAQKRVEPSPTTKDETELDRQTRLPTPPAPTPSPTPKDLKSSRQ